ncbi:hypothetical protein [Limosilactobacillus vaginalis]|uniref:hypothetical protein n=1 Tax=Limosilactobacillus vaginalis TaxID=1633 RepID=UPI0025A4A0CC|nr:hypothetical protein [Limosilactobacillus vaginalis]MDM8222023.1 hypothetical protein [Limosilactobacillus vaginalis]
MEMYTNKFTYDYGENGTVTDAQVGLYGNDKDGQYVSCNLVIKPDDLGKKDDGMAKTFDDVTIKDISTIAKNKMMSYLQGDSKDNSSTAN